MEPAAPIPWREDYPPPGSFESSPPPPRRFAGKLVDAVSRRI
jgi:hypothetical protein